MTRATTHCLCLLLGLAPLSRAADLHVPAQHATIQAAIDAAAPGDTVLVAPGTYVESLHLGEDPISVIGTGGSDRTVIQNDGNNLVVRVVGDGPHLFQGFTIRIPEPIHTGVAAGVSVGGGEHVVRDVVVDGMHVIYCPILVMLNAGGIYVASSRALIEDCTVRGVSGEFDGNCDVPHPDPGGLGGFGLAGVHTSDSFLTPGQAPTLRNVLVEDCAATGFVLQTNAALLEGCTSRDNDGAGFSSDGSAIFRDCRALRNTSTGFSVSRATVARRCVASRNGGSGFLLATSSSVPSDVTMTHCVAHDNVGDGIATGHPAGTVVITDTIVRGDTVDVEATSLVVSHNDFQYGWPGGWPGVGNFSAAPMFVDGPAGDFRLQPGSPCINAGSPNGQFDADGTPPDVGAHPYEPWAQLGGELPGQVPAPTLAGSGSLLPGSAVSLTLSDAPPFSSCHLVIGITALGAPFQGGVLVPAPDVLLSGLAVDATGQNAVQGQWPDSASSGFTLWFQQWVSAPGHPGWLATQGLSGTTP